MHVQNQQIQLNKVVYSVEFVSCVRKLQKAKFINLIIEVSRYLYRRCAKICLINTDT